MHPNKITQATNFLKALNKYLIICWSLFILGFFVYFFGFEEITQRGPLAVFAQDTDTVDLPPEVSIEGEAGDGQAEADLPPEEAISEQADEVISEPESENVTDTVDLPPDEQITEQADEVIEQPVTDTVELPPEERLEERADEVIEEPQGVTDSVYLPPEEAITERPDEVIYEPQSTPAPQPVYEPQREAVRYESPGGGQARGERAQTPTPTPLLSPSAAGPPPSVSLSLIENVCVNNNRVLVRFSLGTNASDIRDFTLYRTGTPVAAVSPGNPVATNEMYPGERARFMARVRTGSGAVGDSNAVDVTAVACASPTPISGGGQVLGASTALAQSAPSPSPTVLPTARPSATVLPSQAPVASSGQVQVITSPNQITVPTTTSTQGGCPAGTTRVQETDSQIICQTNVTQIQSQAVSKQVVLTGVGGVATSSGSPGPQVVNIYKTDATELPKTGLPLAALGFGSLVPLGLGLRRFRNGGSGTSPNSIWMERQLRG